MNTTTSRRPGLLADLNFNLPFVSRSVAHEYDCIITIAIAGEGRKANRYSIDLTGWHKRVNDKVTYKSNLFTPQFVAVANDKNNNLFIIFDHEKEIPESLRLNYNDKIKSISLVSKPAVQKVFIVLKVVQPTFQGSAQKITFKMEKINNDDRMWQLIPIKGIYEEPNKTPKVANFNN